jgi:two-component system cell cycle sensor histidine kinase/response regulator CckA
MCCSTWASTRDTPCPAGGVAGTIRTRDCQLDEEHCRASAFELVPGPYIEIQVEDTGCGIPPELLDKVFEPFFTTRPPGEGSGLGLSAVYGTVVSHRGELALSSRVGQGTVFTLRLPLCDTAGDGLPESQRPRRGSGTLLVVDDEEVIRTTLRAYLEDLGYTVECAAEGTEALDLFRRRRGAFDLVLLDMVMPGMDGPACFEGLRRIAPEVRVLLASGFSPGEDLQQLERQGALGFVRKPYRYAELSRILAGLLADGSPSAAAGGTPTDPAPSHRP